MDNVAKAVGDFDLGGTAGQGCPERTSAHRCAQGLSPWVRVWCSSAPMTKTFLSLFAVVALFSSACSSTSEDTSTKYECTKSTAGDGCYCSVYRSGPAPATAPIECSTAAFSGTVCCANPGWPGTGQPSTGCSCIPRSSGKCDSPQTPVADCKFTATSSNSSGSSSGSSSCDLKAENWYAECSKGCGNVMTCQSFCSGCAPKCYVTCESNGDCEAVGAGGCETSAKGINRCSRAPTKCR